MSRNQWNYGSSLFCGNEYRIIILLMIILIEHLMSRDLERPMFSFPESGEERVRQEKASEGELMCFCGSVISV